MLFPSSRLPSVLGALTLLLDVSGCAYPRRSTSLSPVADTADSANQPLDLWRLTLVGATVPPLARGAIQWDGEGDPPDVFLRLYRDDELVWESQVADGAFNPEWNATLPQNVYLPRNAQLRFELWDDDGMSADPIGVFRSRGLPANVVPGADGRILFEGGAQLAIRIAAPEAYRGIGIKTYEVRGDSLYVVDVETFSPAGRAEIRPGDSIVAIGGQAVSQLGAQHAPGALSMSAERQQRLRVRSSGGQTRDVELDRGYTWLAM